MQNGNFKYRVKITVFPSSGERFVLVEGPDRVAMEETTAYTVVHLRGLGLSPYTMRMHMDAVVMLLEWADDRGIDVYERIGTGNLFTSEELFALRDDLRAKKGQKGAAVVGSGLWRLRSVAIRNYVSWHMKRVINNIPAKEFLRIREYRARLESFEAAMTDGLPSPRTRNREGHSEEVQNTFLAAIMPGSATNPFKKKMQKRNYALLLFYHEHGGRRADALKLKGEDLVLSGPSPSIRVRVRNDDPDDPRKSEPRNKTLPRDLVPSPKLIAAMKDWLADRSAKFNGKRSPYVFVSGNGVPLYETAVNQMFTLLRERVPGLPSDLTTHHKRHDANDRLSDLAKELGWSPEHEQQVRNYMMGWTSTSRQGEQYTARSLRRAAQEASLALQQKSLESKTDA